MPVWTRFFRYSVFLLVLILPILLMSVLSQTDAAILIDVSISEESFVIVVKDGSNTGKDEISLRNFGFKYLYNDVQTTTKLADFYGLESTIDRIPSGACIVITTEDGPGPLPNACLSADTQASISIHRRNRFWYDADTDIFRGITFSNLFTDQNCVWDDFGCIISFQQAAEVVASGTFESTGAQVNDAPVLLAELSLQELPQGFEWALDARGKSAFFRRSDCDAGPSSVIDPDPNAITLFFSCDAPNSVVRLMAYNPLDEVIEWAVYQTQSVDMDVDSAPTSTPDPDRPITGTVSVFQSIVRSGPGTDYEPDKRVQAVYQGAEITITGQYVDPETRRLWYLANIDGNEAWIFGNNVMVNLSAGQSIPWVFANQVPPLILPVIADTDRDGVPDNVDVCPGNPNAVRESECPERDSVGINNNRLVKPAPTFTPTPRPTGTVTFTPTNTFRPASTRTATSTPTATPTPVLPCTISPLDASGASIRSKPATCYSAIGAIAAGQTKTVAGRTTIDNQGWWRLSDGGWVASWVVSESGACSGIPAESVSAPCIATSTPTPTPTSPLPPPPTQPCDLAIREASIKNFNPDNTLPYQTRVKFDVVCMAANQQVWVMVHPAGDKYYGWGPYGSNGEQIVNLGSSPENSCGQNFDIVVIVAESGTISRNPYGNLPGNDAASGAGSGIKGGGACP